MHNVRKLIKKGVEAVSLSTQEKADMMSVVHAHMRLNPAPLIKSPYGGIFAPIKQNTFRNNKTLPILIGLGFLVGGSVSFAAEDTAPGDALYPVKIHMNEPVRSVLSFTPESRAQWELRLVERRLEEVEKLATRVGELSLLDGGIAETNFENSAERVNQRILKLEAVGDSAAADGLSQKLAERIHVHEDKLKKRIETINEHREARFRTLETLKQVRERAEERRVNHGNQGGAH